MLSVAEWICVDDKFQMQFCRSLCENPCRLTDTFWLTLQLLYSTVKWSFYIRVFRAIIHFLSRFAVAVKATPPYVEHTPHYLFTAKSNLPVPHILPTNTKVPRENAREEGWQYHVLHIYDGGPAHEVNATNTCAFPTSRPIQDQAHALRTLCAFLNRLRALIRAASISDSSYW